MTDRNILTNERNLLQRSLELIRAFRHTYEPNGRFPLIGELEDFLATPAEPAGKHEVVKYPDPPYELLGDSGKIHCPMCCGEGMVDPPSENREAPRE